MKKYPVTSARGTTYHVEVSEFKCYTDSYEIGIYKPYKAWFGITMYDLVNRDFKGAVPRYNISDFNYDIVELVKYIINNTELKWEEIENKNKLKKTKELEFEKWNGEFK